MMKLLRLNDGWSTVGASGVRLIDLVQPSMQSCAGPVSGRVRSFVDDSYLCTGQ
jgi:hypothetical protein